MSETIRRDLWHRLNYTPLRDLFRGRISARLDWIGQIESSGLPEAARVALAQSVKRAPLWQMEKIKLAEKLIAHFQDRLARGQTIEKLVDSLNDPRQFERLRPRLNWRKWIETSGLPDQARALLSRVVKRTRLWRTEQRDVADELIAHFMDGMESGATVEQLIQSFGDERSAARLIRRGKVRNRGLIWHAIRAFRYFIGALVAFYILLAVIFYAGGPSVKVDYIQQVNRQIISSSPQDRAWPIYRSVLLSLDPDRRVMHGEDHWTAMVDARPMDTLSPKLAEWLEAHQPQISQLHEAGQKRSVGFVLGREGSIRDPELFPGMQDYAKDNSLLTTLLPHLNHIRRLAYVLAADSALARQKGDGPRVSRNIDAIIGMAEQLNTPLLVEDLVGVSIRILALEQAELMLRQENLTLSDAALRDLAHRLAGPTLAADLLSFEGERVMVQDSLQRMYTDDGHGDGRMTTAGLKHLKEFLPMRFATNDPRADDPWLDIIGPPSVVMMASRAELMREYDRLLAMMNAALHKPLRDVDWSQIDQQKATWHSTRLQTIRYYPLIALVSSVNRVQLTAEQYLSRRDGFLVGIALELHRRKAGQYPQSLTELVPAYLPQLPVDRVDGSPIKYRLVDGKPVVYSVGYDRDDDNGRPPPDRGSTPGNIRAANWTAAPDYDADGDWILFPTPPMPPDAE